MWCDFILVSIEIEDTTDLGVEDYFDRKLCDSARMAMEWADLNAMRREIGHAMHTKKTFVGFLFSVWSI